MTFNKKNGNNTIFDIVVIGEGTNKHQRLFIFLKYYEVEQDGMKNIQNTNIEQFAVYLR
jgi:hypothetical protein